MSKRREDKKHRINYYKNFTNITLSKILHFCGILHQTVKIEFEEGEGRERGKKEDEGERREQKRKSGRERGRRERVEK